ncbi:nuclear transport factor 2 family protein [Aeromicrobium sp.]|uniref:nuclear transport factor 2 family protein n=1 Tax=Aeromicrobium sp. TaxID=1871063 RepID=UPI002FC74A43
MEDLVAHSPGWKLATAVANHDEAALLTLFAPDVSFKGLTPGRVWEADDAGGAVDIMLGSWFEPHDHIDEIVTLEDGDMVADTARVAYRFNMTTPDGPRTAEQQVFYRTEGDQITYARVLCSGFRPL